MLNVTFEAFMLQSLVTAIKGLCDEIKIHCTGEGWTMQRIDICRAVVTCFDIKTDCFKSYYCSQPCEFGISLEALENAIGSVKPEADVKIIKYDSDSLENADKGEFLVFKTQEFNANDLEVNLTCKVPLLDLDIELLEFNAQAEGSAFVTINAKIFTKEINVCKQLGFTNVTLKATKNSLALESDNNTKYRKLFTNGENELRVRSNRNVEMEFSTHYLAKFCKGAALGKTLKMEISDSQISNFEFPLTNSKGDEVDGKVTFKVAPVMA